jgi:SAM-dependent methyltransferase
VFAYRHPEADLYRCRACDHCFADTSSISELIGYDSGYGDDDHRNWFENPNLRLFRFVDRVLSDNEIRSVLDVGCGRAQLLEYLHERHPDWKLTGIEMTPFEPPSGTDLVFGDFSELDFDARFDAIVSLAVIEHTTDPHAFVEKAIACCRPGGLIVLMTLNERSTLYDTSRLLNRMGLSGPFDQLYSRHHLNHFNTRSFAALLRAHGLAIEARFDHHIPAAAIDFEPRGAVEDAVLRVGAMTCFAIGWLVRRCYLQTVVIRTPVA